MMSFKIRFHDVTRVDQSIDKLTDTKMFYNAARDKRDPRAITISSSYGSAVAVHDAIEYEGIAVESVSGPHADPQA